MESNYAADIASIREAQVRIEPYAHKTPVLMSETLNSVAGRKLYFKCECFQKGGAFKFRGACNALFSLDDDQATKGVVTHSSGNHAAALSLAAKLRGIPAYIVVPNDAPICKVENVERYGGHVIFSEPSMKSREDTANKLLRDTGAVLIPSSNDGRVISGQGTICLELLQQAPEIDTLIVPISGGGMASGVALAAKAINPTIRIFAAEPKGADDAFQSKRNGRITKLSAVNTIADGLRAFLGDLTWPIVRDLVDDVIVVEDKEIIRAMRLCYEILKVAVEPSGAIGLAAVLSDSFKKNPSYSECNHVGIVLSGGNVDLGELLNSLGQAMLFFHLMMIWPLKELELIAVVIMLQLFFWLQNSGASLHILLYQKLLQNAKLRMSNVTVVRLSSVNNRCSPGRILQTRCCKIPVLF